MNKFYALMITAGVIASGVVGCGGEAPKKEEKKSAPVAPAKKEEGKKEEGKKTAAPDRGADHHHLLAGLRAFYPATAGLYGLGPKNAPPKSIWRRVWVV